MKLDIEQKNNLLTGVKLATELKSSSPDLRKFLSWAYHNVMQSTFTKEFFNCIFMNADKKRLVIDTLDVPCVLCRRRKAHKGTGQSVPPIQTVKGRVVFFRKGCEKISTLKPLTVWIFGVALRRRKRGTG